MKRLIFVMVVSVVFFTSCKDDSNPAITDPPNPYAQKEIDWPSLQKAPWPMYRHDQQLTGRSNYVGPVKGIISDTINTNRYIKFAGGITIDNGNNAYVLIENDTSENFWSYNLNTKSINWKSNLFVGDDNPNMPTVLSNGYLVASSYDLSIISNNGILQLKKRFPFIVGYNTPIDKAGNIYFVHSQTKTLYCISQSGQTLWTFTDHRINEAGYQISFSPDGNTLYLPCARENSLLALDIATREVKWTFGSLPLHTPPMVDNQGNIYFQKSTVSGVATDTFYCLTPDGSIRWRYIYYKISALADVYYSKELSTIDSEGNIYLLAPRDTLVSLSNDGSLRWKLPLTEFGPGDQLICDVNGTIYFATNNNYVIAVSSTGSILWTIKLPTNGGWYSSPSLTNGKLIVTGNTNQIFIIE